MGPQKTEMETENKGGWKVRRCSFFPPRELAEICKIEKKRQDLGPAFTEFVWVLSPYKIVHEDMYPPLL